MGNALTDLILSVIMFAAIIFALIFAGTALTKRGLITKEALKRAIISIAVFAVIYWGSDYVIGWNEYNVYIKAIEFLAAVIGAGSYWIGSSKQ